MKDISLPPFDYRIAVVDAKLRAMPHTHAIERLKPLINAIANLAEQKVPVRRFLPCYQRLLAGTQAWEDARRILGGGDDIRRSQLRQVAFTCVEGQETWSALFVLTMLWGYGENDDSGPVKLFFALGHPDHERIIEQTATEVLAGQLSKALLTIRRLPEIGTSYGTKFLYAIGTVGINTPIPLVLDRQITKAARRVWGEPQANKFFALKAQGYTYVKGMKRAGDGYVSYCQSMGIVAEKLGVEPVKLEQYLFENSRNV